MTKAFKIAKREYITAVRSREFIIGLVLAPIMMGGSMIAFTLLEDQVDTRDRVIAVVDRSGVLGEAIQAAAKKRESLIGSRVLPGRQDCEAIFS